MRSGLGILVIVACGCYHPSAAVDVPCSAAGTCPGDQVCDLGQSPPRCVAAIADARMLDDGGNEPDSGSPPIDAKPDATALPDAMQDGGGPVVPISFVQANTFKPTAAVTTLALTTAVAAHDAIVVCLNYPSASGASLVSISDTGGDTYAVVAGPIISGGDVHYVAVALDTTAATDTLTITLSAPTGGGSDLLVLEYAGLALANAFDVSANQSGTGTAMTSGSATTTFAHELILGYAETSMATAGAGFTSRAIQTGNMVEDKVVNTIGSYTATATTTSSTWTMIMAAFRGQ